MRRQSPGFDSCTPTALAAAAAWTDGAPTERLDGGRGGGGYKELCVCVSVCVSRCRCPAGAAPLPLHRCLCVCDLLPLCPFVVVAAVVVVAVVVHDRLAAVALWMKVGCAH